MSKCIIEFVEGWTKFGTEKDENRFIHLVRDIAPCAQPEQRWIPVSERLPELGHRVLFKMWNNDVYIGILLKLNDGLKITLEPTGIGYVYSFENVIAWMPLPEPYREGQDG